MKKKVFFIIGILVLVIFILSISLLKKEEKKEEGPKWAEISSKYNYMPQILNIKIPPDFSDEEIIDIYIVSDTLDKKLIEKPFLSGVFSWRQTTADSLGILIPQTLGIRESLKVLPEALDYTLAISKSSKTVAEVEVNQELLDELLKNIEYVEPDDSDPVYITN